MTALGCAHAPPVPGARRVDAIVIDGAHELGAGAIKARIATAESSWWPSWLPLLGRVAWFDEDAWQADLRRIQRFYEARGYFQIQLLDDAVLPSGPGRVKLLVRLREGAAARLEALDISGLEVLSESQRRRALEGLPLRPGDVFLEDAWLTAKRQLGQRLREDGYAEAVVEGQALVDVERPSVRARLTARPGQRYRFGDIFVPTEVGAQVPSKWIREQAAGAIRKGDWYSESALVEAQARVSQLGVFGAVKVNRGAPDVDDGTVPVIVDAREAPFRSLRFGVELGGDSARNAANILFEYANRNLGLSRLLTRDARLDQLEVKARLGWAALPHLFAVARGDDATRTGPIADAAGEYVVPRLFGLQALSSQTSLSVRRALEPAFDYVGTELKSGLVWRPRIDVTVVPALGFNAYLLNSELALGSAAPVAALGCSILPTPCLIGVGDVSVEWDRRDSRLEPTQGTFASLQVQGGLSRTESIIPFLRLAPEVRGYVPLGRARRLSISCRLRLGTLLAPDNRAPILARFFSGGSAMRGFDVRRLSPRVANPVLDARTQAPTVVVDPADPTGPGKALWSALPVGGAGLVEASVELRWRAWDGLSLALFSDVGAVTAEPLGLGPGLLRALFVAVGAGVRYRTPLGPLRFDAALRLPGVGPSLMPAAPVAWTGPDGVARTVHLPRSPGCFLGLGSGSGAAYAGDPEGLCTWHLSVGEAF